MKSPSSDKDAGRECLAVLLSRIRRFPISADDAANLIAAAVEGKLAPAREKRGGRPAIDDDAALIEMRLHVETGASIERAALLVARAVGGQSVAATQKRLARKYRRQFCRNKTS